MDGDSKMCFECLQRRIEADFSGRPTFIHGLSDTPLPFGSQAVVQVSDSDEVTPQQFVLKYVPYIKDDCFGRYVDEYCALEGGHDHAGENTNSSSINQVQAEISVRNFSDKSSDLDTASTEWLHFSNAGRTISLSVCEIC